MNVTFLNAYSKKMINPRKLQFFVYKVTDRARGAKGYSIGVELPDRWQKVSRRQFKTKTDAHYYAIQVINRWMRLYDAAILAQMTSTSPVAAEEVQVVTA